jgi:hypothetical protein
MWFDNNKLFDNSVSILKSSVVGSPDCPSPRSPNYSIVRRHEAGLIGDISKWERLEYAECTVHIMPLGQTSAKDYFCP